MRTSVLPESTRQMKRPAAWLAAVLLLFTIALLAYRIMSLGYPLFPTAPGRTWQLRINAHLVPGDGALRFTLGLPTEYAGRMVVEERVTSGSLHFTLFREGNNRVGVWSGPLEMEGEEVSYRATILIRSWRPTRVHSSGLEPYSSAFDTGELALAERLAVRWKELPLPERFRAAALTAGGEWRTSPPSLADVQAWKALAEKHGRSSFCSGRQKFRPGLAIRVANRRGLLERLECVNRAPVEIFPTTETCAAWARKTFGKT